MNTRQLNVSDLCRKLGVGNYAVSYSVKALRYTISAADDGTWWLTKENHIGLLASEQYSAFADASDAAAEYLEQHNEKETN